MRWNYWKKKMNVWSNTGTELLKQTTSQIYIRWTKPGLCLNSCCFCTTKSQSKCNHIIFSTPLSSSVRAEFASCSCSAEIPSAKVAERAAMEAAIFTIVLLPSLLLSETKIKLIKLKTVKFSNHEVCDFVQNIWRVFQHTCRYSFLTVTKAYILHF